MDDPGSYGRKPEDGIPSRPRTVRPSPGLAVDDESSFPDAPQLGLAPPRLGPSSTEKGGKAASWLRAKQEELADIRADLYGTDVDKKDSPTAFETFIKGESDSALYRSFEGLKRTLPLVTILAAVSVVELKSKRSGIPLGELFSEAALLASKRWIPVGVSTGLYYGLEYTFRVSPEEMLKTEGFIPTRPLENTSPHVTVGPTPPSRFFAGTAAGIITSLPYGVMLGYRYVFAFAVLGGVVGLVAPAYESL